MPLPHLMCPGRWISHVSCAIILWACVPQPVPAFEPAAPASNVTARQSADAPAGTKEDPASRRDLDALRHQAREQQARVEQRLRQATQNQSPGWHIAGLQHEVSQWKYLTLLYGQQQVIEESLQELQDEQLPTDAESANLSLGDDDPSPPYSFLYLESLRDEFDDGKTLIGVLEVEISSAVETVDRARDYQEKKERERRRIKEQINTRKDSEPAEQLRGELLRAELGCRIGGELVNLRKTELAVKKLDLENCQRRQTALGETLHKIEKQTHFTRSDLEKKLRSMDTFEDELQDQLEQSQENLKQLELLHESPEEATAAESDTLPASRDDSTCTRNAARKDQSHPADTRRFCCDALLLEPAFSNAESPGESGRDDRMAGRNQELCAAVSRSTARSRDSADRIASENGHDTQTAE